jgi:hypothetical protein
MSGDAIGMMEGAFFVSKGVILDWINELLDVSLHQLPNPLICSYNWQKLSSALQALCIAKLWTLYTQVLSTSQKLSGVPSSIMSTSRTIKFCKAPSTKTE